MIISTGEKLSASRRDTTINLGTHFQPIVQGLGWLAAHFGCTADLVVSETNHVSMTVAIDFRDTIVGVGGHVIHRFPHHT